MGTSSGAKMTIGTLRSRQNVYCGRLPLALFLMLCLSMLIIGFVSSLAAAQTAAQKPAPDLISAASEAVAKSNATALAQITGPILQGYAPQAMGRSEKRDFTPKEFIDAVAGCAVTPHHRWNEGGFVDWTCGPAPSVGDKCGPVSYRMVIIGSAVMVVVQNILAPSPCDRFQQEADIVTLLGHPILEGKDGSRGALEWPRTATHLRPTSAAALARVDSVLGALLADVALERESQWASAEWTIVYNHRADWLDSSYYSVEASAEAFRKTLIGCSVVDRIALKDLTVLNGLVAFGASFKCPDRGNSYPLVFATLVFRGERLSHAFLLPDQPYLIYRPAKK